MKRKSNSFLGLLGEDTASKYLESLGFKVISRNFRTKYGEIDIVAIDGDTLVFVEVRTRKSIKFGLPEDSITPTKLKRLVKAASYYRLLRPDLKNPMRIDLVSVLLSAVGTVEKVKLFKNISD